MGTNEAVALLVFAAGVLVGWPSPRIARYWPCLNIGQKLRHLGGRNTGDWWGKWRGHRRHICPTAVIREVATRMRSGTETERAWELTLRRHGIVSKGGLGAVPKKYAGVLQLDSLRTCLDYSRDLGAPQARVLQEMAAGLGADSQADDEREIALAGPRLSSRILVTLPVLGVAAAQVMGVDIFTFYTSGIAQMIVSGTGLGLLIGGVAWSRSLISKTQRGV